MIIKNNYNPKNPNSANGIGLTNVRRRLEVLYPGKEHLLMISKDETVHTVNLELRLAKKENIDGA
jgi:LytS/YehU family sensor histidine kinase